MKGAQTYIDAQAKVLKIEQEVRELAEKGKHKLKNKIIHEQLRKASISKNEALSALVTSLNQTVEKQI